VAVGSLKRRAAQIRARFAAPLRFSGCLNARASLPAAPIYLFTKEKV
jgi:hypothetical protein